MVLSVKYYPLINVAITVTRQNLENWGKWAKLLIEQNKQLYGIGKIIEKNELSIKSLH